MIPWADRGPPTQLPPAQLADRLVQSWQTETGRALLRPAAELFLAQVLLETDWSKAMWRFNWGNITAGPSWGGDAWRPSWFELTPDSSPRDVELHEAMLKRKAPSAFRAYSSHDEGSRDYVRQINNRFTPMVAAAETGDPATFAEAVRSTRYCPDCGVGFERSLRVLQTQIRAAGWFSSLSIPASSRGTGLLGTAFGAAVIAAAAGYGALLALNTTRSSS